MSTLRGRLPILLSECIGRGIKIEFGFHMKEPLVGWKYPDGTGGHHHLDRFIPGTHGGNMLEIEQVLEHVLAQNDTRDN
jgi:hypothetical protein